MSKCVVAVNEKSHAVIGQTTGLAGIKLLNRIRYTRGWCGMDA